jgi:sugar lactone lactonase YvrE
MKERIMSTVSRRTIFRGAAALGLTAAVGVSTPEAASARGAGASAVAGGSKGASFPETINLPDGWRPEGITIGDLPFAYFGSLADGSIYRANLITGGGRVISTGPGTPSVGLKIDDRGRLFVCGGPTGNARVVSAVTGEVLATYQFASGTTFVNDVVLTPRAAWFTDSANPVPALYRVPLGRGGGLPTQDEVSTLPLTGDLVFNPTGPNANGIVRTPDGSGLIIVQSNSGNLFKVDPATGVTRTVDLGGESVPNGDGMLLLGRTLFVVQNQRNTVAVLAVNRSGTQARVLERRTDDRFDVPTTIAVFDDRLYLPNARFSTTPTPTTPYTANAIPLR